MSEIETLLDKLQFISLRRELAKGELLAECAAAKWELERLRDAAFDDSTELAMLRAQINERDLADAELLEAHRLGWEDPDNHPPQKFEDVFARWAAARGTATAAPGATPPPAAPSSAAPGDG